MARNMSIPALLTLTLVLFTGDSVADLIDFEGGSEGERVGANDIVTFSNALHAEASADRIVVAAGSGVDITSAGATEFGRMFITDLRGDHSVEASYDRRFRTDAVAISSSEPASDVSLQIEAYPGSFDRFGAVTDIGKKRNAGIGGGDRAGMLDEFTGTGITSISADVWTVPGTVDLTRWTLKNPEYTVTPIPAGALLGMFGLTVVGVKLRKYA